MISGRKRNKVMRAICDIYYENYVEKINLSVVCAKTKYDFDEIIKICVFLETQEVIVCDFDKVTKEYDFKDGKSLVHYKKPEPPAFVTIKKPGISYFETKRDDIVAFIKKSIITPIVISILTTLAINWLPNLLELMIELVQSYLNS